MDEDTFSKVKLAETKQVRSITEKRLDLATHTDLFAEMDAEWIHGHLDQIDGIYNNGNKLYLQLNYQVHTDG